MSDRGQTFTLEAFVAAILLVATVGFALQAVAVSSNTASAGETELKNQHVGLAEGILSEAASNGSLQTTVLYWDNSTKAFYNADSDDYYTSQLPPTPDGTALGDALEQTFGDRQVRYNVNLHYQDSAGDRQTQKLIESGTPNDDAVRVVETVTLYDDTVLVDENEDPTEMSLADADDFYAEDVSEGPLYNVIRVEVVLWS